MTTSRRGLLAQASALGAASLGLGAAQPAEAQAGPITIALASRAPTGLNPQKTALTGGDSWAIRQVFDTLVKAEDGTFAVRPGDFRPSLAEAWESSADARTWTYRLRRGVQFHKGQGEMTSEDVAFTYGRQLDPSIVTNQKALFANLERIEAPDRYTVRFHLRRPDPLFNGSMVTTLSANILCKRAFEERGAERFNMDPIGTGAYQVDSVSPAQGVMLSAFPQHFGGVAASPSLRIAFIADTTARTLAFASGQVDMIEGVRQPGWIPTIRQRAPRTIFDATAPGSFNSLHLNLTRAPLDDLRVRQAIRLAINNAQIAAAFSGLSVPMVGIIAPQFAGAVKDEDLPAELRYGHNIARARTLLAEAGHPNGVTIPCFTSQREDYASIMLMIQEQLRAAGINLDMRIIDHATMHAENRRDRNAMTLYSSSFPPIPWQPFLQQLLSRAQVKPDGRGGENYSHYGVAMPGIDAQIEKALDEPDFDRRVAVIQDIERQVLRDLPLLGIVTLSYVIARNPRVDLGFPVESGYAYWPLNRARRVA
ncbi:ABC transporter substrate-binding protein [Roseomonas sp. AR75]|uniref:ABC transporter substrate-binding protein n=1 Tax=Roseomonas sp. AR75 TaxID=2562311 RepID=UPI0010C00AA5|nr:ABC transporter substrate-binding protein [Roseomonas sp. AR75]